jgi:hypothetical protein
MTDEGGPGNGPSVSTGRWEGMQTECSRKLRRHGGMVAVAVALAWSCFVPHIATAAPVGLYVVFHSDHTFGVSLANGTAVGSTSGASSVIAAGTYQLFVDDTSDTDSLFDLAGPGVKLVTDMTHGEDSTASFVETFQPSSAYTYRDDNHPAIVWTFVTDAGGSTSGVGSGSPSGGVTTGTPTVAKSGKPPASSDIVGSAVVPFRGTLAASVDAAGKLGLTKKGKAVGTLRAGLYTFTVRDDSARSGFAIQRLKASAITLTGVGYKGTHVKTIDLKAGHWAFFSPGGKKSYFIVVS